MTGPTAPGAAEPGTTAAEATAGGPTTTGPATGPGPAEGAAAGPATDGPTATGPATDRPGTAVGREAAGRAVGYRPGRTLPLRVEAVRQLRRRRTLVSLGLVAALPLVLLAAFAIGGAPADDDGGSPGLVPLATGSGPNFAAFVLFAATGFLLPVVVALYCGDTVASEAGWSTLRYLLAAPVPRARLLLRKLAVALGLGALAVVLFAAVALAAGTAAYGWGEVRLPDGGALPASEVLWRMAVVTGYVYGSLLVVGALGFWLSTVTDAPLGAVGGAVGLTIVSTILDAVTALGQARALLPTHRQYAWTDALQPRIEWSGMVEGLVVSGSYAVVLTALAFRGFARKDVVS
ncbi:ABC transporter permease [Streptomyces sp. NPDC005805]|uniref:ABC transporter permease subunit n=1 Tax=Streptomyces sp. NPDC005805 TaxID=3157068 RepID=UPI0033CA1E08